MKQVHSIPWCMLHFILLCRLTSKWSRYFCTYNKENKLFQVMSSFHSSSSVTASFNQAGSPSGGYFAPMIVKTCTRRSTDSIDKRFCFDLEIEVGGICLWERSVLKNPWLAGLRCSAYPEVVVLLNGNFHVTTWRCGRPKLQFFVYIVVNIL